MIIRKTDTRALKKRMIDLNIKNIQQLSDRSGVNRRTLGSIMNGKEQPSADVMEKLITALQIRLCDAGEVFFAVDLRGA